MGDILANAKIIKSNRQPKNLKQILTKAKLKMIQEMKHPRFLNAKTQNVEFVKILLKEKALHSKMAPHSK